MAKDMKYFRNIELSKMYRVSKATIANWIESTIAGKVDLQLYTEKDRTFIINSSHNHSIMDQLTQKGKKYKNKKVFKNVKATPEFYQRFNEKEIADIINNIEINRDIPHQYAYYDEGASYWDSYMNKLAKESVPNALTNTIQLLDYNNLYISHLLDDFDEVNVIDIGPGNAFPVKNLLTHLIEKKKFNKYIATDLSQSMLDLAKKNLKEWFGEDFKFEGFIRDLNFDRLQDILFKNETSSAKKSLNLVLFLGGTIATQSKPEHTLNVIRNSMSVNDYLIFTFKLDTQKSRIYFDFSSDEASVIDTTKQERIILDLLGIEEDFYEIVQYYDEKRKFRVMEIKLKVDLNIEIEKYKKVISLNNSDKISLWHAFHMNYVQMIELFDRSDFEILHTSRSEDEEQLLVVSKVKRSFN